jgi:polar amino acid transport system permease protein
MNYNWQWYRVPPYLWRLVDGEIIWGPLLRGLLVTLDITLWSLLLAIVLGLVSALLRLSPSLVGRGLARTYLELTRNTPLLVQLYVFYFALSPVFALDRYLTGILALAIFEGAYLSEIFRAGILAVGRGQWEAARSLGLSTPLTYRFVVLPQALRVILPPTTGQVINLVKSSAMVSVIAVFDLTTEGRSIIAETFMTFEIWLTVAALYLLVTVVLSLLMTGLERRLRTAQ